MYILLDEKTTTCKVDRSALIGALEVKFNAFLGQTN